MIFVLKILYQVRILYAAAEASAAAAVLLLWYLFSSAVRIHVATRFSMMTAPHRVTPILAINLFY